MMTAKQDRSAFILRPFSVVQESRRRREALGMMKVSIIEGRNSLQLLLRGSIALAVRLILDTDRSRAQQCAAGGQRITSDRLEP